MPRNQIQAELESRARPEPVERAAARRAVELDDGEVGDGRTRLDHEGDATAAATTSDVEQAGSASLSMNTTRLRSTTSFGRRERLRAAPPGRAGP
jgi:hypothetical protein